MFHCVPLRLKPFYFLSLLQLTKLTGRNHSELAGPSHGEGREGHMPLGGTSRGGQHFLGMLKIVEQIHG